MPRSGRYLLDTNVLIALLSGEPSVTAERGDSGFCSRHYFGRALLRSQKSPGDQPRILQVIDRLAAGAAVLVCGPGTVSTEEISDLQADLASVPSSIH